MENRRVPCAGNKIISPPPDVLRQGLARIRLWFRDRQGFAPRPMRQVPLFLVGLGAAGKSAFAHVLSNADVAEVARLVRTKKKDVADWSAEELADWVMAAPPNGWNGRADSAARVQLAAYLRAQGAGGRCVLDAERSKKLEHDSSPAVPAGTWTEFYKAVQNLDRKK